MRIFGLVSFLVLVFWEPGGQTGEKYFAEGYASYYAERFHGQETANGELFNMADLSAAHRTLPFNTYLKVTNRNNNISTLVRVNDRGPYLKKRIIDLSESAARMIGGYHHGVTPVRLEEFEFDSLDGEIDSLYRNEPVMDCLGNIDTLRKISMTIWSTKFLMHALYVANDLFLKEKAEKILVCGKNKTNSRTYHIVLSNISSEAEFGKMRNYYEKKGFIRVNRFK